MWLRFEVEEATGWRQGVHVQTRFGDASVYRDHLTCQRFGQEARGFKRKPRAARCLPSISIHAATTRR